MSEHKLRAAVEAASRATQLITITTAQLNELLSHNGSRKQLRKKLKLVR